MAEPSTVKVLLIFGKEKHNIDVDLNQTLGDFRQEVQKLTNVETAKQKIMLKGALTDDSKTLGELGVKGKSKLLLIGSTNDEISAVKTPVPIVEFEKEESKAAVEKPLSEVLPHKKVIDKGIPEGAEPGIKNHHEALPDRAIQNIIFSSASAVKARLTFKLFTGELWIQSASNTVKIQFAQIRTVTFEPITGHEEYSILILHTGPVESKSRYYIYWVPSQYCRAMRDAIMKR